MNNRLKLAIVLCGATALTTLGVAASDVLRSVEGRLSAVVIESDAPVCAAGTVLVSFGEYVVCFDAYEASPGPDCPERDTRSQLVTAKNIQATECTPTSVPEAQPWRNVSLTEAQQLCARAGKRLPTPQEWYRAASGLASEEQCVLDADNVEVTTVGRCMAPSQVHDLVGNVWEWVEAEVINGSYNGRALPAAGYVVGVDSAGVAIETSSQESQSFGSDYAWLDDEGVYGLVRGGYYGSGDDGGVYTINATVPTSLQTPGIGFRCIQDVVI